MHRKQIWQPWVAQGRSVLNYATEHIPHVVIGIPFAVFCEWFIFRITIYLFIYLFVLFSHGGHCK